MGIVWWTFFLLAFCFTTTVRFSALRFVCACPPCIYVLSRACTVVAVVFFSSLSYVFLHDCRTDPVPIRCQPQGDATLSRDLERNGTGYGQAYKKASGLWHVARIDDRRQMLHRTVRKRWASPTCVREVSELLPMPDAWGSSENMFRECCWCRTASRVWCCCLKCDHIARAAIEAARFWVKYFSWMTDFS